MSLLNIGGDVHDGNFRYQMPALDVKVEGRGGSVRTSVLNMVVIAKALHIHPAYPTKFFGLELGAQSRYDAATEQATVNGVHRASDLQKLLEKFIQQFILCPNCKLPELITSIKSSSVEIACAACPFSSEIKSTHRLVAFMQKHPPASFISKKQQKHAGEEFGVAALSVAAHSATCTGGCATAEEDRFESDEALSDDWHTDTSKAAVKKRQDAEFAEMRAGGAATVEQILQSAKADNKGDSPVTILKIFLASKARSPSEISAELRRLAMSRTLDEPQKLKILLEAIIDISKPKEVVAQFKAQSALLKTFTSTPAAAASAASSPSSESKTSSLTLLTCIEDLIGVVERKLLPYAPHILKTLYEEEVLEESTLLAWADAPPEASWLVNKDVAAEVRAKAQPFIDWLKTADEEDEEGEDE